MSTPVSSNGHPWQKLDPNLPPWLHLVSAFLAMEPTDSLISISRLCGGGVVTEEVQKFIWDNCISGKDGRGYAHYLKKFVKKLILEIESNHLTVLDELYDQCGHYMSSLKDDGLGKQDMRVSKCVSFLFPCGSLGLPSCPKSGKLVIPLNCSLNMLEGDTGCSVWPSSLYLSEFILSFPEMFSGKSCFEIGSGVGLVGVCLSHIKASKVILTDGDLSTLANMKLNLELNSLRTRTESDVQDTSIIDQSTVNCIHLPWESATESELQEFTPDIILGADIIYDPSCLPHLVRLLFILFSQMKAGSQMHKDSCVGSSLANRCVDARTKGTEGEVLPANVLDSLDCNTVQNGCSSDPSHVKELPSRSLDIRSRNSPVAYIASVIRNADTFNCFLELAEKANLVITDITETIRPFDLLPYMQSYNRSIIRLFTITCREPPPSTERKLLNLLH